MLHLLITWNGNQVVPSNCLCPKFGKPTFILTFDLCPSFILPKYTQVNTHGSIDLKWTSKDDRWFSNNLKWRKWKAETAGKPPLGAGSCQGRWSFTWSQIYTSHGISPRVQKLPHYWDDKQSHQTSSHLSPEQRQVNVAGFSGDGSRALLPYSKVQRFQVEHPRGPGAFLCGVCMSFLCLRGFSQLPPTVQRHAFGEHGNWLH